ERMADRLLARRLGEGPVPRRQLVVPEEAPAERRLGAVEIRCELRAAPALRPLVVVPRLAANQDTRVVCRAAAEDPRSQLRAVVAGSRPAMRVEREPARVEDVLRPAAVRVR